MTWVQDLDLHCKAVLRSYCSQKLEEMISLLQVGGRGGRGGRGEPGAWPCSRSTAPVFPSASLGICCSFLGGSLQRVRRGPGAAP